MKGYFWRSRARVVEISLSYLLTSGGGMVGSYATSCVLAVFKVINKSLTVQSYLSCFALEIISTWSYNLYFKILSAMSEYCKLVDTNAPFLDGLICSVGLLHWGLPRHKNYNRVWPIK